MLDPDHFQNNRLYIGSMPGRNLTNAEIYELKEYEKRLAAYTSKLQNAKAVTS